MKKKKIVIIGGGIAGLSTAHGILEQCSEEGLKDLEVTILEGKERLGGNIGTERIGGYLIEGGPDCFLSEKPWAMALCRRIGLSDELLPTSTEHTRTFILSGGNLHPMPEGMILMVPTKFTPMITSRLITWPGKIRMGIELFIPKKRDNKEESLGGFVRRRLGAEALDKIAEPLVAGVHGGDPETMSVQACFPKFLKMEQDYGSLIKGMITRMGEMRRAIAAKKKAQPSVPEDKAKGPGSHGGGPPRVTMFMTLKGGLSTLIDRLRERVSAFNISTGAVVEGVEKVEGDGGPSRYLVRVAGGPNLECDALVVATPSYVASGFVEPFDAGLSGELAAIEYASTITISLGYKRKDVGHPLDGFGYVVPKSEGRKIMAASWTSVKFAGRAPDDSVLIRCFIGGAKNADLVDLPEEELKGLVKAELREVMGVSAEPEFLRLFKWPRSMPQYTLGHLGRIDSIEEKVKGHDGLFLTGAAYRGIGISDNVRNGEAAAGRVLEYLGLASPDPVSPNPVSPNPVSPNPVSTDKDKEGRAG